MPAVERWLSISAIAAPTERDTVIAQAPRIASFVAAMRANIAADLDIAPDCVNVKGKTTERLGFAGRGEGIATEAVALLLRD